MFPLITSLLLGALLGMRHALEPDHLAALSVLVTGRGGKRGTALLGAAWGMGHTVSLLVVGCVLATVGTRLPARLANAFELLVGVMLLILGVRAIARSMLALAPSDTSSATPRRVLRQPLVVGAIHGLAGSGALTALVLSNLPTLMMRVGYIALFGLGSSLGMACLTGLASWPLARIAQHEKLRRALSLVTGSGSVALGAFWGWSALAALCEGSFSAFVFAACAT